MRILPIKTNSKQYNIYIGYNAITKINNILKRENIHFNKCLIIADSNVPKIFIKKIRSKVNSKKKILFSLKASEKNKNFKYINSIIEILLANNFTRNDVIICLGGGIAGDVSGFAASIFKRGLKFVNIPSTLLSQVDSSIGGKTGVNNKFGKNLIGSFYQPDLVISDLKLLNSLPRREIICGYAEIFKHSLIKNRNLFFYLNKNLQDILQLKKKFIEKAILESCKIKKQIVEQDEKENDLRKSLNLGHTFGHSYEATLNYSRKLNHGEAVLYGILSATKLSKKLKILNDKDYQLILSHLYSLDFKNLSKYFKIKDLSRIVNFMLSDKKNISKKINFITLRKIGNVNINIYLSPSRVRQFIKSELLK
tara:strand:- start:366 stop:1463 length:1098 start_codon:yes stop_codon:yes gene_type:complete